MSKLSDWWKDLWIQKIDGYICPINAKEPHKDENLKVLNRFGAKYIKFRIPFLDAQTHCTQMVFVPKDFQNSLEFLRRLMYVLPIQCLFKRRILQGFKKTDFDLIEIWSAKIYKEIQDQAFADALAQDYELMQKEELRANEMVRKAIEKKNKKLEDKQAAAAEKERKKQEEKERKRLEKEAKKAESKKAK